MKLRRVRRRTFVTTVLAPVIVSLLVSGCGAREGSSPDDGEVDVPGAVRDALSSEGVVEILDPVCCEGSLYAEALAEVIRRTGGEANVTQVADITQHFPVLAAREVGFSPSIWDFSMPEQFHRYIDQEGSILQRPSGIEAIEGWYFPTYAMDGDPDRGIEPTCPGLPDWKALNECADVFATAETGDKGAYHLAGQEWAKYYGDEDRIENLDLDYETVFAGSEASLTAAISRAYERGEPILALGWEPHYVTLKYDMTRVEFPPYSDECWGTTYACQWPEIELFSIMSADFPTEQPIAYKILENSDFTNEDMLDMMVEVEEEGKSFEEAAVDWVDANPERWESWIPEEPVAPADAQAEAESASAEAVRGESAQ